MQRAKVVEIGGKVGRWPQAWVYQNPLFVPLNSEGCALLSLSRAVTTRLYSFLLWINLSKRFSCPYGRGVREDGKLFRGGTWLMGSPTAAHCVCHKLYSDGVGLHQPCSIVHISALPCGVVLSSATAHTTSVVWSWLLCMLVLSRIYGKW